MNCSAQPQSVLGKEDTVDGEKVDVIDNDSDVADTMLRTTTLTGNDNENVIDGCRISLTAATVKKRRFDQDYLWYNQWRHFGWNWLKSHGSQDLVRNMMTGSLSWQLPGKSDKDVAYGYHETST